jgi:hypothetical protein
MNKSFFLFVVLLTCLSISISAQSWGNGVSGEGAVVKQEISLDKFDGFDLGFDGNVIVTPGSVQKVVIEGQQNIIDLIKRDVKDGMWRIGFSKSVKDAKEVTVYITIPTVTRVALTGSGSISSTDRFSGLNKLDIAMSGSGDIVFDAAANDMNLHLSGSGDIEVKGTTKTLDVAISGSGDVVASELKSSNCKIHISGSGDAEVLVNGDLETNISGSGDVHYKGEANVTARISGSGEVSKM